MDRNWATKVMVLFHLKEEVNPLDNLCMIHHRQLREPNRINNLVLSDRVVQTSMVA